MKNERKEELKDEMKNRISLALKDPILQQGFEIICKENAELKHQLEHRNCLDCSNHSSNLRMRNLDLEKENAELQGKLNIANTNGENFLGQIADLAKENAELERKLEQTEKDLADYQFNYPTIKELEKENAELKEELKDANEKVVHLACNQNKDLKRKLTKAKELLKKWVEFFKPKGGNIPPTPIQVETEQFLNSEVENV